MSADHTAEELESVRRSIEVGTRSEQESRARRSRTGMLAAALMLASPPVLRPGPKEPPREWVRQQTRDRVHRDEALARAAANRDPRDDERRRRKLAKVARRRNRA